VNKPRDILIGSNSVQGNNFCAGVKKPWLYSGNVNSQTNVEDIKNYLESKCNGDISVKELTTKGINKSFQVGLNFSELDKTKTSDFWPENVRVRQFIFNKNFHNTLNNIDKT